MSDAQQPQHPPPFPTGIPPYPPAPPPPPPVPYAQRFPTWKQAFVMFGGGLALAVSACFGCLFATVGSGGRVASSLEGLALLLAVIAFGGMLAALVGVVLVFMRMLRALFAKRDDVGSGTWGGTPSGGASSSGDGGDSDSGSSRSSSSSDSSSDSDGGGDGD